MRRVRKLLVQSELRSESESDNVKISSDETMTSVVARQRKKRVVL